MADTFVAIHRQLRSAILMNQNSEYLGVRIDPDDTRPILIVPYM